jgi:hypothetical protein
MYLLAIKSHDNRSHAASRRLAFSCSLPLSAVFIYVRHVTFSFFYIGLSFSPTCSAQSIVTLMVASLLLHLSSAFQASLWKSRPTFQVYLRLDLRPQPLPNMHRLIRAQRATQMWSEYTRLLSCIQSHPWPLRTLSALSQPCSLPALTFPQLASHTQPSSPSRQASGVSPVVAPSAANSDYSAHSHSHGHHHRHSTTTQAWK